MDARTDRTARKEKGHKGEEGRKEGTEGRTERNQDAVRFDQAIERHAFLLRLLVRRRRGGLASASHDGQLYLTAGEFNTTSPSLSPPFNSLEGE